MMAGQLGLPLSEVMTYTMRQLFVMHDAMLLRDWDQTAAVISHLHNITQIVATWGSKKKPKLKSWAECHPYRAEHGNVRDTVTPDNLDELRKRFAGADDGTVPVQEGDGVQ